MPPPDRADNASKDTACCSASAHRPNAAYTSIRAMVRRLNSMPEGRLPRWRRWLHRTGEGLGPIVVGRHGQPTSFAEVNDVLHGLKAAAVLTSTCIS